MLDREESHAKYSVTEFGSRAESRNCFQINNYAFHDARVRYVGLGRTEMWSLTTKGDPAGVPEFGIPLLSHVFHIRIDPFQVRRTWPDGARRRCGRIRRWSSAGRR
jgi:hypothetical protein